MVTYSTNFMGPISMQWYVKNNIPFREVTEPNRFAEGGMLTRKVYEMYYYGGRIDVDNGEPFGTEIGVPIMDAPSWSALQEFCDTLETDTVWTMAQIEQAMFDTTGVKINWFRKT